MFATGDTDRRGKIAVLTSGGDSPGMNAAIVSIARFAAMHHMDCFGVQHGYAGLMRFADGAKDELLPIPLDTLLDIADLPGTYLRTARCDEFRSSPQVREHIARALHAVGLDALIVIGGDGSFNGALRLIELGIPCVGIPGTIDNDLGYTDMTLGFDTAVNVCVDAVRSIRATSRSHDRPAVVEVMGRNCGDIAMRTAISTGAEMVLVQEMQWNIDEVAERFNKLIAAGNTRATLVVAEGCYDPKAFVPMENPTWQAYLAAAYDREDGPVKKKPSHIIHADDGLTAERLASVLKRKCGGAEFRATVVGYTQRGVTPTAYDSAFAFEAGRLAVDLILNSKTGVAIGTRDGRVNGRTPIEEAVRQKGTFDEALYGQINSL